MSGLWERVKESADDNVPVHLIISGIKAYHVYTVDNTKGATKAQILAAINSLLDTDLAGAEITDLNNIATELDSLSNNTAKLIYLSNLEYAFTAAEMGVINEAKWRNDLGIA